MKVCIIGNGLTTLSLAKILVNMGINVHIFSNLNLKKIDRSRTLSISKNNIDFFNSNISNINKLLWQINKIEIFSENLKDEKVINFADNEDKLFSIVKNYQLFEQLTKELSKSKLLRFKKKSKINVKKLARDYNLVINTDSNNLITKRYLYKKINKNYNSHAFTSILDHKKLKNNNTAVQIFTKNGPLAFLPVSENKTSVVYSMRDLKNVNLKNLIKKYNNKYSIINFGHISNFELQSLNLRSYYYKNILAFGDMLHKLHPLAGQGFNMSLRDIKDLSKIIRFKLDHGLDLDNSICLDFENKTKHKNF